MHRGQYRASAGALRGRWQGEDASWASEDTSMYVPPDETETEGYRVMGA